MGCNSGKLPGDPDAIMRSVLLGASHQRGSGGGGGGGSGSEAAAAWTRKCGKLGQRGVFARLGAFARLGSGRDDDHRGWEGAPGRSGLEAAPSAKRTLLARHESPQESKTAIENSLCKETTADADSDTCVPSSSDSNMGSISEGSSGTPMQQLGGAVPGEEMTARGSSSLFDESYWRERRAPAQTAKITSAVDSCGSGVSHCMSGLSNLLGPAVRPLVRQTRSQGSGDSGSGGLGVGGGGGAAQSALKDGGGGAAARRAFERSFERRSSRSDMRGSSSGLMSSFGSTRSEARSSRSNSGLLPAARIHTDAPRSVRSEGRSSGSQRSSGSTLGDTPMQSSDSMVSSCSLRAGNGEVPMRLQRSLEKWEALRQRQGAA